MPFLFAIPVAAQLLVPIADHVPQFNVRPSCEAVAVRGTFQTPLDVCLRAENEARDNLKQHWTDYSAVSRDRCSALSTTGGVPSYVELLTCLEMNKQARTLGNPKIDHPTIGPAGSSPTTTGQAPHEER